VHTQEKIGGQKVTKKQATELARKLAKDSGQAIVLSTTDRGRWVIEYRPPARRGKEGLFEQPARIIWGNNEE